MYIGDKKVANWGVVTDVTIGEPPLREKRYTIPGKNGDIDASEALTGYPIYDCRPLSISLFVKEKTPEEYQKVYDDIYAHCHGKVRQVFFSFDNDHYYEGRLKVTPGKNDKTRGDVTVSGSMYPYAFKKEITEIDISSTSSEAREVTLSTEGMPTKINIDTDAEITITRGESSLVFSAGKHIINTPLLLCNEIIIVEGAATAKISYQEGKL